MKIFRCRRSPEIDRLFDRVDANGRENMFNRFLDCEMSHRL